VHACTARRGDGTGCRLARALGLPRVRLSPYPGQFARRLSRKTARESGPGSPRVAARFLGRVRQLDLRQRLQRRPPRRGLVRRDQDFPWTRGPRFCPPDFALQVHRRSGLRCWSLHTRRGRDLPTGLLYASFGFHRQAVMHQIGRSPGPLGLWDRVPGARAPHHRESGLVWHHGHRLCVGVLYGPCASVRGKSLCPPRRSGGACERDGGAGYRQLPNRFRPHRPRGRRP